MMKRKKFALPGAGLAACLLAAFCGPARGGDPDFDADAPEMLVLPSGEALLRWHAKPGCTYFIQTADPGQAETHLVSWIWAPLVETGQGQEISYEVGSTAERAFFRLVRIPRTPPPGVDPEDWDADGDGLPNFWELVHGLHPLLSADASAPFPGGGGATNLEAYLAGVQAEPGATMADFDGDGLANESDAAPRDRLLAWKRTGLTRYALLDLGAQTAGWTPADLSGDGAVLFREGIWRAGGAAPHAFPEISGSFHDEQNEETILYKARAQYGFRFSPEGDRVLFAARCTPEPGSQWSGGDGWDTALAGAGGGGQPAWQAGPDSSPGADFAEHCPAGIDSQGRALLVGRFLEEHPAGSGEWKERRVLEYYSPSGGWLASAPGPGNFDPVWSPDPRLSSASPSGWFACNAADALSNPGAVARRLVLRSPSGALQSLPAAAAGGWKWPVHLCEIPGLSAPVLAAGSPDGSAAVFVRDSGGLWQTARAFSGAPVRGLAGNGTALDAALRLWANGEWLAPSGWCPRLDGLLAAGQSYDFVDSNGAGAYLLVRTDGDPASAETKLAVPVEVQVRDPAAGKWVSARGLKIARWETAWNRLGFDENFIDGNSGDEPERFRLRVASEFLPENMRRVFLSTAGSPGAEHDDPPTEIILEKDPGAPDLGIPSRGYLSKPMILVADAVDNRFRNDDALNDQTHLAALGSRLELRFPNEDSPAAILSAKPEKRVDIAVKLLWQGGDGPKQATLDKLSGSLRVAREIYAQAGIELRFSVAGAKVALQGVDLSDGLWLFGDGSANLNPTPEAKALLDLYATPGNGSDVICLFLDSELTTGSAQRGRRRGIAFQDNQEILPYLAYPISFWSDAASAHYKGTFMVSGRRATPATFAHELGHILGLLHVSDEKPPDGRNDGHNVLAQATRYLGFLDDTKRFRLFQVLRMRSSQYADNP